MGHHSRTTTIKIIKNLSGTPQPENGTDAVTRSKAPLLTRRKFLIVLAGASAAVAFAMLYEFRASPSTKVGIFYPVGNRVVRIRPIWDSNVWGLPNYTADQVLNVISDLKPTTLNRYISGPQVASQSVPVSSGQSPMTAQQFLQSSIDACRNPNQTTMFPRLSLKYLGQGTFFQYAQNLYSICQALNPPQVLLSLDNSANHTVQEMAGVGSQLYAMGWKGLAIGACGVVGLPDGTCTFDQICANPTTGAVDTAQLMAIQQGQPSVKEFEGQIDLPGAFSQFAALSPDQEATVLTNLASQQSISGYRYMYPVLQSYIPIGGTLDWDATKVFTSQPGPYGGISIYQLMKNLMNQYN